MIPTPFLKFTTFKLFFYDISEGILNIFITTAVPVITVSPPGPITVAEGNNVELKCRATGNETLTYQWMRVSGSLPNNTKGKTTPTLTICNIAVSDNGQYYCEVNNDDGASMSSMKVQVIVKSKSLIIICIVSVKFVAYRETLHYC